MNYATIDLEWKQETAEIICASFWKDNTGEIFDNIDQLLNYIFQREEKETLNIFSHYGGGSDFLFLLRNIIGRRNCYLNEKEFYQANSKIISFKVYHGKSKYQFRDSYAILPASLEKLSQSFLGESKLEDSGRLNELSRERIKSQCLNDARLLYKTIERFMDKLKLDNLQLTAASQALMDMKNRADFNLLETQTKEEYELFRNWFYGGHVDVYKRYSSPVYHYDIKSCYPTSQYCFGAPIGKYKEVTKFDHNKAGLYIIKTNNKFYNPLFPFKKDLKTYWVNSNDFVTVTDIELREIRGLNFKIIKGYEWELDWNFFKLFITHWFNFRKLGKAENEIGKIYLNAGGFGKFSINRERESIVFGKNADYYFSPDYEIGVKKIWKDFDYSQIHIGARITAGARVLLFNAQNKFGNDHIIYSDTDSVFASKMIQTSTGFLGDLEYQDTYEKGYFLGNKFYGLKNYDGTFKGILKGFPEKFDEKNYSDALFKDELNFKYAKKKLLKFKSALRRASDFVAVFDFLREIKHIEIKRKLCLDGINTLPYNLKNGELK